MPKIIRPFEHRETMAALTFLALQIWWRPRLSGSLLVRRWGLACSGCRLRRHCGILWPCGLVCTQSMLGERVASTPLPLRRAGLRCDVSVFFFHGSCTAEIHFYVECRRCRFGWLQQQCGRRRRRRRRATTEIVGYNNNVATNTGDGVGSVSVAFMEAKLFIEIHGSCF